MTLFRQIHKPVRAVAVIFLFAAIIYCGSYSSYNVGAFNYTASEERTAGFDGGDGSEENPYLISTAAQLDNVRNYSGTFDDSGFPYLGSHFRLTANIDLNDYLAEGGAGFEKWGDKGWQPIKMGASRLNGGGFTVKGLFINRPDERNVGLFGTLSDSYVDNLVVELSDKGVVGHAYTGGIAGLITSVDMVRDGAAIRGCSVKGSVWAAIGREASFPSACAGLIVGSAMVAEVENCYAEGRVRGAVVIGGIAGEAQYAGISDCYFTGGLEVTAPAEWNTTCAAGIAGTAVDTLLSNCVFIAEGDSPRTAAIAGFNGKPRSDGEAIALTPPTIRNCYYNADGFSGELHFAESKDKRIAENSRGLTDKELKNAKNLIGFDFDTVWGFTKEGDLVLRSFGNAYDPPDLTWLWITIACVLIEGGLIATGIILYRRKKRVVVTRTVEVEKEVIREVPRTVLPLPGDLSARERRVAELILKGMSRREIAGALNISDGAVGTYAARIYIKAGVSGQKEFIAYYLGGRTKN